MNQGRIEEEGAPEDLFREPTIAAPGGIPEEREILRV